MEFKADSKKRHIEFTLQATTKRVRFCLDITEAPSLPYALAVLGLLGENVHTVRSRLNACARKSVALLHVHVRALPILGMTLEKWHMIVVRRAVLATPFDLEDRKESCQNAGGFKELLDPKKAFLVDGHMNARYTRSDPCLSVMYTMRDGCETEKSWRCMVALTGGRLYSPDLPTEGISIDNMWLDQNGKVNQEKGFLKRILKVYEVCRRRDVSISDIQDDNKNRTKRVPVCISDTRDDIENLIQGVPVIDFVNMLCR